MIRDRIVVGIKKITVKERLLREPELTLESAISICRADEESKKGLSIMAEEAEAVSCGEEDKEVLEITRYSKESWDINLPLQQMRKHSWK